MRGKLQYIVGLAGICAASVASAAVKPEAVRMGPVLFVPTVSITQSHNDNLFYQKTGTKSSWLTDVAPSFQFYAQDNADKFQVGYNGDYGRYASSSADNYNDHTFSASTSFVAGRLSQFNLDAIYRHAHDPRGTGATEGAAALSVPHPDKYHSLQYDATWNLGYKGAPMSFRLSATHLNKFYVNNLAYTVFRDYAENGMQFRVYGNVSGNLRYFYEFDNTNIGYRVPPIVGPSLDSSQRANYVGVEWQFTGKTKGSAKIGRLNKNFKDPSLASDNLTAWEAQVAWSPRTFTTFTLATSRQPEETNGTGTAINHNSNSLEWTYDWNSYLHSDVMAMYGHDTYQDSSRVDNLREYTVGVNYDIRRWVNLAFNYMHDKRSSNVSQFDYSQNIYGLTLTMSM